MKYIKITCLIALLIISSGCKKWLDVNEDPATPQTSKAEFYLAPIIAQMAVATINDYSNVQFKYTQNMGAQTTVDVAERHGWTSADAFGGVMWRFVYVNAGLNLEDMIRKAKEVDNNTLTGVGYAIKAWGFQTLTDSHGPVVLDEAFNDQLTFHYQDQPEVYAKVREWCQLALVHLNKPDVGDYTAIVKANDYLFGGSVSPDIATYRSRWRKFVYAILATQYSHLINKPDFNAKYADSVVKYVDLSFGGITLNASEDATIGFDGTNSSNSNPMSVTGGVISGTGTGRIGQPIVNYLTGGVRGTPTPNPTSSIDPRLTRMLSPMVTPTVPATNNVYKGVVATKGDAPTTKTIPNVLGSVAAPFPGKYIFGNGLATTDRPRFPLYTFSQLQFAKAEALFRKGLTGPAYTAYTNGIRGHMDFVNLYGRNGSTAAPVISSIEIENYMNSSEVAKSGATLTIADIMGQKYIAQWGWAGQEQWCDMRKYHYDPVVFRQFRQLDGTEAFSNSSATGVRYAYRIRPRFNSEYVWNKQELEVWGGNSPLYSYQETWFSLP